MCSSEFAQRVLHWRLGGKRVPLGAQQREPVLQHARAAASARNALLFAPPTAAAARAAARPRAARLRPSVPARENGRSRSVRLHAAAALLTFHNFIRNHN